MKTVSIFNIKGGVAKTISTINIGAVLQEQGKRVLILDIDPQGNSSKLLNNRRIREGRKYISKECYSLQEKTINDILLDEKADIEELIKHTDYKGLDIITSNADLEFTEKTILNDKNRDQINILKSALKKVDKKYDYCIIDCPPNLNIVTVNALMASNDLIIPLKIDQMSIDGIGNLLGRVKEITDDLNGKVEFKGCFVTMDKPRTRVNKLVKELLKDMLGDKLLDTCINDSPKVIESTFEQRPVVFYAKKSAPSLQYRNLVKELF